MSKRDIKRQVARAKVKRQGGNQGMGGMAGGESPAEKAARIEAKEQARIESLIDAELKDTQGIDDAIEAHQDIRGQQLDDAKFHRRDIVHQRKARDFLQSRYKAMTDVGLPGAPDAEAIKRGQFSLAAHLDGLGEIDANTPEAFYWNMGNDARLRVGTEYTDVDAFTGQRSIIPSTDPTDSKKALTLFEGTQNQARAIGDIGKDATGFGKENPTNATEYVQRQIMRRMGRQVHSLNNKDVTAPDFEEITDGGKKIVDGQIWNKSMPNKQSQLFTDVNTGSNMRSPRAQAQEVRRRLTDTIAKNPKASLGQVVKTLGNTDDPNYMLKGGYDKELGRRRTPDKGKVYADTHHPKDAVFYADYTDEEAIRLMRANHSANSFSDTEMLAPNQVREEDVKKVKEVFENKRGSDIYDSIVIQPKYNNRSTIEGVMNDAERAKTTKFTPEFKAEKPEVQQFLRTVENGVEVTPDSGIGPTADSPHISTTPVGTPQAPRKSAAGLGVEDFTPEAVRKPSGGGGGGGWLADTTEVPFIRQTQEVVGGVLNSKAARFAGKGLLALPVIGAVADAGDAYAGTKDAVDSSKSGLERRKGLVKGGAGITGLATLAAPAAPLLAPVAGGMAGAHMLGEWTDHRRATDSKYTANSGKAEKAGRFSHTEDNPVSIGLPGPVQSETQRRRQARTSSSGAKPVARPQTGQQWWQQALGSLGLN